MTAIVTGAGSGIGCATAQLLLEKGEDVVAVDISPDRLSWTDGLAIQGRCARYEGDVSTEEANAGMVAEAVATFGAVDVVVLAAGVAAVGHFDEMPLSEMDRVLDVNLRSVLLGVRAAIPELVKSSRGAIVTVASVSGLRGEPAMAAYAAAKGGVVNFTRSIAVELGPRGVRANCVCPGPTSSRMTEHLSEAAAASIVRAVPMGRFAKPEEIAEVIAYLTSPAASFVTGVCVAVDGGLTANVGHARPNSV